MNNQRYDGLAHSIAVRFHDAYESLAPQYGYETRDDTKKFDSESKNGKLMIATVQKLLDEKTIGIPYPKDKS